MMTTTQGAKDPRSLVDWYQDQEALPTEPMVTVLVVTYQHAAFIRQAVESILSQRTSFAFEILIREDCSTDGTQAILLELQRSHPDRIRLCLAKENLYGHGLRLRMIDHVRGKYMARLDGDDYWTDPTKLQQQVDALEADEEAVGCFTNGWNEREGVRSDYVGQWLHGTKPPAKVRLVDLLGNNYVPTASLMYRTAVQRRSKPVPTTVKLGDQVLHVNLLRSGHYIYQDKHTCVRRVHSGGVISMKNALYKLETNIQTLDAIHDMLNEADQVVLRKRSAGFMVKAIPVAARTGEVDKARQYLQRLRSMPEYDLPFMRRLRLHLFVRFPKLMDAYVRRGQQRKR